MPRPDVAVVGTGRKQSREYQPQIPVLRKRRRKNAASKMPKLKPPRAKGGRRTQKSQEPDLEIENMLPGFAAIPKPKEPKATRRN